jgi:hypothetical protein
LQYASLFSSKLSLFPLTSSPCRNRMSRPIWPKPAAFTSSRHTSIGIIAHAVDFEYRRVAGRQVASRASALMNYRRAIGRRSWLVSTRRCSKRPTRQCPSGTSKTTAMKSICSSITPRSSSLRHCAPTSGEHEAPGVGYRTLGANPGVTVRGIAESWRDTCFDAAESGREPPK